MNTAPDKLTSRRQFLKHSAVLGGALAAPSILAGKTFGAESGDTLRVGLIGCGGRGTGAANQALNADKNVVLTAMADAFEDRLKSSLENLKKAAVADRVKVEPGRCFVGFDAYQKVIDSGVDVVLLATPPGFRPQHLKAAVAAGKHIFTEKPMAVDAPGVRMVMAAAEEAKKKKLSLVAGFCWRYEPARREFYKRIHDGAIGDVRAIHATYLAGPVKPMPPASDRPAGMGDMEWQMRNWYNFVWICGDGLVEQACHSVDKIAWAMKDAPPLKAVATGGRQVPNNTGNIFDHIDVFYEFANGVRATMAQRQISGCHTDNSDYLIGSTGTGTIRGWNPPEIRNQESWRYRGEKRDMYQIEHDELFASIRKGEPLNDGVWMAQSTMMAIMGRMAAYTGQEIMWEQALNSQEDLTKIALGQENEPGDPKLSWDVKPRFLPVPTPGKTKFI
jgi:predicted dehydrogenase